MIRESEELTLCVSFGPELPIKVGEVVPLKDENGIVLGMFLVKALSFGEGDSVDIKLEYVS